MSRIWTNVYVDGDKEALVVHTTPSGVRTVERWKLVGPSTDGVLMERNGRYWPFPKEAVETQLAFGRTVVEGSVAKELP